MLEFNKWQLKTVKKYWIGAWFHYILEQMVESCGCFEDWCSCVEGNLSKIGEILYKICEKGRKN